MSTLARLVILAAAFAVSVARGAAPVTLPACIIDFTFDSTGGFSDRVVLFDVSGSYTEIKMFSMTKGIQDGSTTAPRRGSFTYLVDSQDAQHASIVYDGGGGPLSNDQLYFYTAAGGGSQPRRSAYSGAGGVNLFTMFPQQSAAGAINLSNRTAVGAGNATITGFVIGGTQTTWVLIRAVGASLATFGVSPTASQPSFLVYDGKQAVAGSSLAWGADPNLIPGYKAIAARVGAFPLADNSDEGVFLMPLKPGAYTAVITAASPGQILSEIYILPYSAETP